MKKLLCLAVVFIMLLCNTGVSFAQPPALDAGAYILIDAETGDVLCEMDSQKSLYPASTTKIMTAILALEMGDPNQEMTASQSAIDDIGPDGSNIGIIAGEKIRLVNLLQALLISSANEAANIIAENLCDSREEFIERMNQRAAELGATGTHFANACGLHDPMHYTTASDLAKIARHAMTLPKFREIVRTPTYEMPATNKHSQWPVLSNTNKLMISDKNDIYVINGVKTGFTGQAGYNLVSSATDSSGMELIAVVLAVKNEGAAENIRKYSKELLDYGFNNFKRVKLLEEGAVYRNIKVENAIDIDGLDLIISKGLMGVLPKTNTMTDIKEIPHISENVTAPVNKGDVMGTVEFFRENVSIGKVELIAARDILNKPEPVTLVSRIKDAFNTVYVKIALTIAGFLLFFILLRKVLRTLSRRVNRRRRR